MSLFEGFTKIRLVKGGPGWREKVERWAAGAHHKVVVNCLCRFRRQLERDMRPESWLDLEAPLVVILADLCNGLGLNEGERAGVLGTEGVLALADELETGIRPIPSPRLPMNERQSRALAYVREHGEIGMGIYRQICPHWSDETLRLDLANLVARGLLVKNGTKKGTRYTLAS